LCVRTGVFGLQRRPEYSCQLSYAKLRTVTKEAKNDRSKIRGGYLV